MLFCDTWFWFVLYTVSGDNSEGGGKVGVGEEGGGGGGLKRAGQFSGDSRAPDPKRKRT